MTEVSGDDFLALLEAEIADASAKSKLKSDAKELKKKAHNMRLSTKARAEAAKEYREIQAIVEADQWIPIRSGALFAEQVCDGCGSIHFNFLQYMEQQRNFKNASTVRWVRVSLPNLELEKETIIQPLTTHICSDCCEDHGFDARKPTIRLMPVEGSLTVSHTYVQGDINGSSEES